MIAVPIEKSTPTYRDVPSFVQEVQPEYPVYCVRPAVLRESAREFIEIFPGTVMYSVKCNPNPGVINALYEAGVRDFETASLPEIKQVAEMSGRTCAYFMHPVKTRTAIRIAYGQYGVRHFVVDHRSELQKLIDEIGSNRVVVFVRVCPPESSDALYSMSKKFGASAEEAVCLLRGIEQARYQTGVTFHVGSQCLNPKDFGAALDLVGGVLESAAVEPACIDVGGGFPVRYPNVGAPPLTDYIREITEGIRRNALPGTAMAFAEPGRALVGSGCSLLTRVVLRKTDRIYLNDGIHGGLSELIDSQYQLNTRVIRIGGPVAERIQPYHVFGPTCDSIDHLPPEFMLPTDLRNGDWIEFDQVGAYSNALSTSFNGFSSNQFIEVFDEPISASGNATGSR
ncbi:MAG: type III PLP-dependent enzyme [Woeseia sp.]